MTTLPRRNRDRIFFTFHEIDYMLVPFCLNDFISSLSLITCQSIVLPVNYLAIFKISYLDLGNLLGKVYTEKVGIVGLLVCLTMGLVQ